MSFMQFNSFLGGRSSYSQEKRPQPRTREGPRDRPSGSGLLSTDGGGCCFDLNLELCGEPATLTWSSTAPACSAAPAPPPRSCSG
jgi:hypothetical protein